MVPYQMEEKHRAHPRATEMYFKINLSECDSVWLVDMITIRIIQVFFIFVFDITRPHNAIRERGEKHFQLESAISRLFVWRAHCDTYNNKIFVGNFRNSLKNTAIGGRIRAVCSRIRGNRFQLLYLTFIRRMINMNDTNVYIAGASVSVAIRFSNIACTWLR